MKKNCSFFILILILSSLQWGMAGRSGQYDEEAREMERQEKLQKKAAKKYPMKQTAAGQVSDAAEEAGESAEEDAEEEVGKLESAKRGTEKVLNSTVKGAVKVATLGYGDAEHYQVQEPEKGTDEPTKIKIKI